MFPGNYPQRLCLATLAWNLIRSMERCHSRGQQLWKKEIFYLTKEFNSHWTGSGVMWKRYIEKDKARNNLQ